jgi:hypothetical protein
VANQLIPDYAGSSPDGKGRIDAFSRLGLYQARLEVFCRFERHEETMV